MSMTTFCSAFGCNYHFSLSFFPGVASCLVPFYYGHTTPHVSFLIVNNLRMAFDDEG